MVGGHTVTSSVEVAHPTIAVERVPGLVPAVPVRPVPPVLIAVAGVQGARGWARVGRGGPAPPVLTVVGGAGGGGKGAPPLAPGGFPRHAGAFRAVVVERGEPKPRQSAATSRTRTVRSWRALSAR